MNGLTMPPLIDVVIPVYNGGKTIQASLQSICNQSVRDIRVIVVDDGSTDETPRILERMAAEDARIVVITTENRGIVDALNTGLEAVRADLIARFDADDIAFENRFAVQRAYLDAHPDCAAVGCNVYFTDDDGVRTGETSNYPFSVPRDPYHVPASEPYLLHPFLLTRRRAIEQSGPYRHAFHSEDADLYWRLSDSGALINLPDVLGEYRVHAGSVSGLSALNGRVSAVNSQLAAVSERRRSAGRPDIAFPPARLEQYKKAMTLDGILALASQDLTPDEAAYLAIATSAKLLELSSYRPYRLDAADFATMRAIIRSHHRMLGRDNRLRLLFRQIIAPRGLRPWTELSKLIPWSVYPLAMVELSAYSFEKLRSRIRPSPGRLKPR